MPKTVLGTSCENSLRPPDSPLNESEGQISRQIETLADLIKSAPKTSAKKADPFRKNLVDLSTSIRQAIFESHPSISVVDQYNSAILHATFITLRPPGLQWINRRAKRLSALDARTAVELLATDTDGFSWSNLTHELGILGKMNDVRFFNEVVPHIQNHIQFEAALLGFQAGVKNIYYYHNIALNIANSTQLEAIRLGFAAHFVNLLFYQNIALKVTTDLQLKALEAGIKGHLGYLYFQDVALRIATREQLEAVRRGVRSGFTDLKYYSRIVK